MDITIQLIEWRLFVTVNRLVSKKIIIAYSRKSFDHEDTNGNKEKEARLTRR